MHPPRMQALLGYQIYELDDAVDPPLRRFFPCKAVPGVPYVHSVAGTTSADTKFSELLAEVPHFWNKTGA
jgi:hypothetical protein